VQTLSFYCAETHQNINIKTTEEAHGLSNMRQLRFDEIIETFVET
jgi:hypothetical protein